MFTFLDYSEEESSFKFHNGAITPVSLAGYLTQFAALRTATENIVLGNISHDMWVGDRTNYANAAPTDENAQRERKWLVRYEGTTSHSVYTATIPTADLVGRLLPDSDEADLTDPQIAAWITAFEAIARTPEDEAVNVIDIEAVGRRG